MISFILAQIRKTLGSPSIRYQSDANVNPLVFAFWEVCGRGRGSYWESHYSDVIMSAMASQITSVSNVCSTVCSGASLAFVRGIHRWPVDSLTKSQQRGKRFHLMASHHAEPLGRIFNRQTCRLLNFTCIQFKRMIIRQGFFFNGYSIVYDR